MKKKSIIIFSIFISIFLSNIFFFFRDDSKSFKKEVYYNGNNLRISIDGINSDSLPKDGTYYLVNYDCKSSNTKVSWDKDNYKLNVSNGNKKGGISCYLTFESNPKISDMDIIGSYVKYTGNNGCDGKECLGQNANYVNDDDMGYCHNSSYKYISNGWRVAYVKDKSTHLISAGSPECLCTNSNGSTSTNNCNSPDTSFGALEHVTNLNKASLKYCNKDYAYNGVCDIDSTWNFSIKDSKKMTIKSFDVCDENNSNMDCGYHNTLIENGGFYWSTISISDISNKLYYWDSMNYGVSSSLSNNAYGIRPIIRMDSNVVITGGSGTYKDPYIIENNTFLINDDVSQISLDNSSNIKLSLKAVNATKMCISIDTSVCTNYIDFTDTYKLDLSDESAGEKLIYVYYKDENDRVIATIYKTITLLDANDEKDF